MANNVTATVKRYKASVMTLNTETTEIQTLPVFSKSSDPEKIMKIAHKLFKGTHNVPAKIVEVEIVEKKYIVDIQTFIEQSAIITKPADIKGDAITRTVKMWVADVMCLDTDGAEVLHYTRPVKSNDPEKAMKELQRWFKGTTTVPAKILGFEELNTVYGMTIEKFTHIATEVTE